MSLTAWLSDLKHALKMTLNLKFDENLMKIPETWWMEIMKTYEEMANAQKVTLWNLVDVKWFGIVRSARFNMIRKKMWYFVKDVKIHDMSEISNLENHRGTLNVLLENLRLKFKFCWLNLRALRGPAVL